MGYDAPSPPSSVAARDAKKKRGNRSSAKLKQCKLDARREQWLSQGKDMKEAKAAASPTATGAVSNSGSPILASPHPPLPRRRADVRLRGGVPEEDREDANATAQEVGSSDIDSPLHSPVSDNSQGSGHAQRKGCSGSGGGPSLSSVSSLWSSSRSVSDPEDDDTGSGPDEDNGALDDWEAVADAFSLADNKHCNQSSGPVESSEVPNVFDPPANAVKRTEPIRSNARAWTPNDIFRPQSLPSISKQASFLASIDNCWVGMGTSGTHQGVLPSSCPICCEDLDPTDSSFLPCPCGFHLCLFCHKRILEADQRCPGCRKPYNAVSAGEATATSIELRQEMMKNVVPVRLPRSYSMDPRY